MYLSVYVLITHFTHFKVCYSTVDVYGVCTYVVAGYVGTFGIRRNMRLVYTE